MTTGLTQEQRQTLWEQFVEVHAKSQEAYDSSIRALASAGVAVTVSLGAALEAFGSSGVAAAVGFLVSLLFNLLSYVTAQLDMRDRLRDLRAGRVAGIEGNWWTKATHVLNALAGIAFLVGGALLALFVASTA
jgi:hypothetical protein